MSESTPAAPAAAQPFRVGVNYWPRSIAMGMWKSYPREEVEADLRRCANLGIRDLRFFLLWEDFQPAPESTDAPGWNHLARFADAAAVEGIRLMPTLFCGNMSGANWIPRWALDPTYPARRFDTISGGVRERHGIRDFYKDDRMLEAQSRFCERLIAVLRGHPAIWAVDVGNEFSNLRPPQRAEDAAGWAAELASFLRPLGVPITGGCHGEDLGEDRRLRPSSLCASWDFSSMHGYPAYSAWSRGPLDTEVVPFLATLMRRLGGRPVLFAEFGSPTSTEPGWMENPVTGRVYLGDGEEAAALAERTLAGLRQVGSLGGYWWCYGDYPNSLAGAAPFDRNPQEMGFGMVPADGPDKPAARALAAACAREDRVESSLRALEDLGEVDEEDFYAHLPDAVGDLYATWLERRLGPAQARPPTATPAHGA